MERATPPMTQQIPGGAAPRAAQPGMGMGNVPYARGMMSGNFGEKNVALPGGRGVSQIDPIPRPSAPPSSPSPQDMSPSPGGPPPAMGPQSSPFLQPQFLFEVYAAIMDSLHKASQSDGLPWGYTY